MKFLKKSQLNFRNVKDNSVAVQIDGEITLDSTNTVLVPKGTTAERPVSPVNGHLRYNTTVNEFEFYQNNAWRKVDYKEPTLITQQNLGNGNDQEVYFGPLDSGNTDYPYPELSKPQHLIVLVENVFQIATTNYALSDNPYRTVSNVLSFTNGSNVISTPVQNFTNTTLKKFYGPLNSGVAGSLIPATVNDIAVYVNNSLVPTANYSLTDNPYRLTSTGIVFNAINNSIDSTNESFDTYGFYNGQVITVTGSNNNNRTFTITSAFDYRLVVAETVVAEPAGNSVSLIDTNFPVGRYVNFATPPSVGLPVKVVYKFGVDFVASGFYVGQSITVSGSTSNNGVYTIFSLTEQSITVAQTLTTEALGQTVTVFVATKPVGRYIKFSEPVPIGKPVTVIHGFDR